MPKACPYCGRNSVPHFLYWYNESLNVALTGIRQRLFRNRLIKYWRQTSGQQRLLLALLKLGMALHLVRPQNQVENCQVRRAQVLWQEAKQRGIDLTELLLLGKSIDCYLAKRHGEILVFSGLPRPAKYFNAVLDIMDDKWLFKKILQQQHLPVPAGGSARNFSQAWQIFQHLRTPVIVKPRLGSRGRHTTIFVNNKEQLRRAVDIAHQLCHWVVVEEQLVGPVYRATVIDFKLVGVLRGDPPQVVGDGQQTIGQLIEQTNQRRPARVQTIPVDPATQTFLAYQNLSLSSVPSPGVVVTVSAKIGLSYGGSSAEEFEACHVDNRDLFVAAARALGDPVVGFDFILPDITRSWKEQHCGFIEANSLPFINLHHDPLRGQPRNVAAAVWDMLGW